MEMFKISRFAINRAVKSGDLKVTKKEGRKYIFSETDLQDFLERSNNRKEST